MSIPRCIASICTILGLTLAASAAFAQKKYDPGASDTEIKIGQTMPYSGPASAYGTLGKAEAAYFKKINDEGGINGRKIVFLSVDDGYSPPKTVEATRRLIEQDQVLLMFASLGTAPNLAVRAYLNAHKVPQLFVASGATTWDDPKNHPWTMGLQPNYQTEARIYAKHSWSSPASSPGSSWTPCPGRRTPAQSSASTSPRPRPTGAVSVPGCTWPWPPARSRTARRPRRRDPA